MHEGGCLCGAIRYRIATTIKWVTHCHCGMCRKQHGAAFATYATVGRKHVQVGDPEGLLEAYRSSEGVTRSFCRRCGSSLFWANDLHPKLIEVALGTLDGDPAHPPDAHIHVASKARWVTIHDGLPQHPDDPPHGS